MGNVQGSIIEWLEYEESRCKDIGAVSGLTSAQYLEAKRWLKTVKDRLEELAAFDLLDKRTVEGMRCHDCKKMVRPEDGGYFVRHAPQIRCIKCQSSARQEMSPTTFDFCDSEDG